jgi:hypothetical protein
MGLAGRPLLYLIVDNEWAYVKGFFVGSGAGRVRRNAVWHMLSGAEADGVRFGSSSGKT